MKSEYLELLKRKCGEENYAKLESLKNDKLHDFVGKYVQLCNPDSVFVCTDSAQDAEYVRAKAIEKGEEKPLGIDGHTIHFDGYFDQARDKANTKYLLDGDESLGSDINSAERKEGLDEIQGLMTDTMVGKTMYVCFFCLGPTNSEFSISAVQITDSSYAAHAENILYRSGYEQFRKIGDGKNFFRFLHSAGTIKDGVSSDVKNRRVYIDLKEEMVYSINTQYAGNTVGLKKLAMRLAIKRGSQEGWLTEHMFIMGVQGPDNKRETYFTGSFPSACGKTATAMLDGEKIIGDDIAYLREVDGVIRVVNVERGIFGIIKDVNDENDPSIFQALTTPREVIFSNVLIDEDNQPRWLGDGRPDPEGGVNYSGDWKPGKRGPDEKKVTPSHKNARYTIKINELENCHKDLENADGVPIGGIIYGGRDSDTSVPVVQSFDWAHGILTQGATIESETTAATLGQEGVRVFNPMANLDFLSIPIGKYIQNNLDMGAGVDEAPKIFHVNYFLRDKDGEYHNGINDKHVWIKWMELRVNNEAEAIKTPVGFIPEYEDLAELFEKVLDKSYGKDEYEEQFTLRIPENIAKIERIKEIYTTKVSDTPPVLMKTLDEQEARLNKCREKHGNYVSPSVLKDEYVMPDGVIK